MEIIKELEGGSLATTKLIKSRDRLLVRKTAKDEGGLGAQKLYEQFIWLKMMQADPSIINVNLGAFQNDSFVYDMEYFKGDQLGSALENLDLDNEASLKIIDELCSNIVKSIDYTNNIEIKEIHPDYLNRYIDLFHLDKWKERVSFMVKQRKDNKLFESLLFKGFTFGPHDKYVPSLNELMLNIKNDNDLMELLKPKKAVMSHGDFTFLNILVNVRGDLKIIDPRGTPYDTVYYDIGKLFQSCLARYDSIFKGDFDISYNSDNVTIDFNKHNKLYFIVNKEINKHLSKSFTEEDLLIAKFYCASHMISMAPFRAKESEKNLVACMAIGLNMLADFIEEGRKLYA